MRNHYYPYELLNLTRFTSKNMIYLLGMDSVHYCQPITGVRTLKELLRPHHPQMRSALQMLERSAVCLILDGFQWNYGVWVSEAA
jgi:hypothetical protein